MAKTGVYSYSKNKHGFARRCATMLKEQRARIYILRRCATMLLCSYIRDDE
jgi:DVL family